MSRKRSKLARKRRDGEEILHASLDAIEEFGGERYESVRIAFEHASEEVCGRLPAFISLVQWLSNDALHYARRNKRFRYYVAVRAIAVLYGNPEKDFKFPNEKITPKAIHLIDRALIAEYFRRAAVCRVRYPQDPLAEPCTVVLRDQAFKALYCEPSDQEQVLELILSHGDGLGDDGWEELEKDVAAYELESVWVRTELPRRRPRGPNHRGFRELLVESVRDFRSILRQIRQQHGSGERYEAARQSILSGYRGMRAELISKETEIRAERDRKFAELYFKYFPVKPSPLQ